MGDSVNVLQGVYDYDEDSCCFWVVMDSLDDTCFDHSIFDYYELDGPILLQNDQMNKKLTIMVCGYSTDSRTLVARYIEELLISKGLSVDRIPDNGEAMLDDYEAKSKKLPENLEVVIKGVQLKYRGNVSEEDVHDELAGIDRIEEK